MAKKPTWWNNPGQAGTFGIRWDSLTPKQQKGYIRRGPAQKPIDITKAAADAKAAAENAKTVEYPYLGVPGGELRNAKGKTKGYSPGSPKIPAPLTGLGNMPGTLAPFGQPQRPKYVEGDQWKPGYDGSMTVDEIIDLQNKMKLLKLYTPGSNVRMGVWGPGDAQAYEQLLAGANTNMEDVKDYLNKALEHPELITKDETRQPLVVTLTNEKDIKNLARKVSQDLYGGDLPRTTLDNIIKSFHDEELRTQTTNYNLDVTGGTQTAPPELSNYIEEQVRQQHPEQVAATAFGSRMKAVLDTFTGGGLGAG